MKTKQLLETSPGGTESSNHQKKWGIYHRDREFAREQNDPCLIVITAESKTEAEHKAAWLGIKGQTGLWASEVKP